MIDRNRTNYPIDIMNGFSLFFLKKKGGTVGTGEKLPSSSHSYQININNNENNKRDSERKMNKNASKKIPPYTLHLFFLLPSSYNNHENKRILGDNIVE